MLTVVLVLAILDIYLNLYAFLQLKLQISMVNRGIKIAFIHEKLFIKGESMKLENSESLQNLINAYAGESQAAMRYTFYAKQAKKEGYEQISAVFEETANNEKEHAKLFYKMIPSAEHRRVNSNYPFFIGNTLDNLNAAAKGEREEFEGIYRHAANIAKEEGFDDIQRLFAGIVEIEKRHTHRYEVLAENLKKNTLFKKEEQSQWICRKCGHTLISKNAPEKCPICSHPQGYFQIYSEKF